MRSNPDALTRAVALLEALGLFGIAIAAETLMMPAGRLQKIMEVRESARSPGQVTGGLVNLSSTPVRSIQVRTGSTAHGCGPTSAIPVPDNPGISVV